MKAYVIKNKEGKYFDKEDRVFLSICGLDYAWCIFYTIKEANYYIDYHGLKDCEVVEITILEGDLEKQIRTDERRKVCEEIRNFMTQDSCLTKEELIECLESFTAKSIFQLLDQIEGETK